MSGWVGGREGGGGGARGREEVKEIKAGRAMGGDQGRRRGLRDRDGGRKGVVGEMERWTEGRMERKMEGGTGEESN